MRQIFIRSTDPRAAAAPVRCWRRSFFTRKRWLRAAGSRAKTCNSRHLRPRLLRRSAKAKPVADSPLTGRHWSLFVQTFDDMFTFNLEGKIHRE